MKKLLLFIVLLIVHSSWSQDPYYINYSTNEGLPSATIYSIYQDEKGFLWFTTDSGIVKYDSHTFTLYNTDDGLSDNEVFQMKKDHKGRIWLLTLNGKTCYYYKDKLYNENNSDLIRKISSSSLLIDLYEDSQNNCHFVYKYGNIITLTADNRVIKKNYPNYSFAGIWKNNNGLYFLSSSGIYDDKSKIRNPYFSASNYYRMFHSGNKNYFSEKNHLYYINADNQIFALATLPNDAEILQIFVENPNKMYICTRKGLYLFEDQKITNHFFKNDIISNITKDFEGSYWISTLKKGVFYVPSFDVFVDNLNEVNPPKLNCISINKVNEIWIGGDNNNYYHKYPGKPFTKKTFFTDGQTDQIKNIRFFDSNTYIIGKKTVLKVDATKKTIHCGFGGNDIMILDRDIIIGYSNIFKINSSYLDTNNPPALKGKELLKKRGTVFTKDFDNNIWIGTNSGLYKYAKKDSITNWDRKLGGQQTTITDLYFDGNLPSLFVATASKGLYHFKKDGAVHQISKKQGLNSISCNSIKKIAADYYLVGTNNGLNSIQFINNATKVKNLNALLGLKNKRINDVEFANNTVYLATDEGLLNFNIKNIRRKKNRLRCWILNLKNGNKLLSPDSLHKLSYHNNNVSIKFVGISYINQNNLTYYYKLDGQNDTWSSTTESQINYRALDSKKYVFKVYCIDGFGSTSAVQSISFEILAPFWKKTWFLILCTLLLALSIYAYVKYRLKHQEKQFALEKITIQMERDKANLHREMIELEQKALRLQMNPHFIFNALNTIKGYYSEGDAINASAYISKFSKLLRMLLENTEQTIPLSTEIEMLQLYINLAQTRYKNKFDYELFVDDYINSNETAIPTLLLQPIVENAIIHGLAPKENKGLLKVYFLKKGTQLECIVEDNGIGREASKNNQMHKEYQSKAIEITTERINLFSENIGKSHFEIIDLVSNGIPSGTRVIVTIPLISIWQ
jgi:sensor histidine kinase YesM/ligand-binding sensor domain-containing protein